jgi:hypothetical protein
MRLECLDHRTTQVARRSNCVKYQYQLFPLSWRNSRGFLGDRTPDSGGSLLISFNRLSSAGPSHLFPRALFHSRDLYLEMPTMIVLCHSINVAGLRLKTKTAPIVA